MTATWKCPLFMFSRTTKQKVSTTVATCWSAPCGTMCVSTMRWDCLCTWHGVPATSPLLSMPLSLRPSPTVDRECSQPLCPHLSVCLSVCLLVHLPVYLPACVSACLPAFVAEAVFFSRIYTPILSTCLLVCLPDCLLACLSVCLPVCRSLLQRLCSSTGYTLPSVCPSVCLHFFMVGYH